jgi:hypothetical protein
VIEYEKALLPSINKTMSMKDLEMLGEIRLTEGRHLGKRRNAQLTFTEGTENQEPRGFRESLEASGHETHYLFRATGIKRITLRHQKNSPIDYIRVASQKPTVRLSPEKQTESEARMRFICNEYLTAPKVKTDAAVQTWTRAIQ